MPQPGRSEIATFFEAFPNATVWANNVNGQGYEIGLVDGKFDYSITHSAPYEQLKIQTADPIPTGRWVHITTTYDGNSRAAGMMRPTTPPFDAA